MSDPLALLPFALAAGGGRIDGIGAPALVAAGVTLLQRSAPLVRALSGRRSGILLPVGPAFLTALAASDGREALMLDPAAGRHELGAQLAHDDIGAVFTVAAFAALVPPSVPCVLLDEAPTTAILRRDGLSRPIDLGTHHGLLLEGSPDADGLPEVCLAVSDPLGRPAPGLTHRQLLTAMRAATARFGISATDRLSIALPWSEWHWALIVTGATLRAGGSVRTFASPLDVSASDQGRLRDATILVADAATLSAWADAIAPFAYQMAPTAFRHVVVVGPQPDRHRCAHIEHAFGRVLTPAIDSSLA